MGRLIYSHHVSLDGFIEGPNGELDWPIVDEELHHPVVLRGGKPFLPRDGGVFRIRLAEATRLGASVVLLRYCPSCEGD